jgi:hypothetical protein
MHQWTSLSCGRYIRNGSRPGKKGGTIMIKLNAVIMAIIIFIFFVVGIGGSMLFNIWKTQSGKVPITFKDGDFEGLPNPADIRGSYSFGDIETAFEVPAGDLAKAFGVETWEDKRGFLCKYLEELYLNAVPDHEIGTDSVRFFTSLYTGLPYNPDKATALPEAALELLLKKAKITETRGVEIKDHFFPVLLYDQKPDDETGTAKEQISVEHDENEDNRLIKGKTTFYDLQQWGLSKEDIISVTNDDGWINNQTVRDWALNKGLEFSDYMEKLQKLVDNQ